MLPYVSPLSASAQYPGNSELMALWLMLPVHRDSLVQLASLPGVAMLVAGTALLARSLGSTRSAAMVAGIVVPAMPRYLDRLVGTNMQDMAAAGAIACMAGFVAVDRAAPRRVNLVAAGVAGGIAAGSRFAALAVVPIIIVWLALQRRRQGRSPRALATDFAWFALPLLLLCGYWYGRNLVTTGDPVYPQSLPWHHVQATEALIFPRFRSYIGAAPHDFVVAAGQALKFDGPIFLLMAASSLVLPILALSRRGTRPGLLWSLLPLATFVAYLATPASAGLSVNGRLAPDLQALNLRYALPMVGLTAGVTAAALSSFGARVQLTSLALFGWGALASTLAIGARFEAAGALVAAFRQPRRAPPGRTLEATLAAAPAGSQRRGWWRSC